MDKEPFGLSDEMKNLYKVLGEIATSGLPDIIKTIGSNLLNTVSEFSAMTASLGQSTSWTLPYDTLKAMIDVTDWAGKLQFPHMFDEMKRIVESPQYMAAIKGMTTFAKDFDWQWLADLQAKFDYPHESSVEEVIQQITEEDRKQIYEDVIEVIQQPEQMQVGLEQKYENWKKNHPMQSDFFFQVFIPILLWLLSFLSQTQSATTITNSNIYEAPVSNSKIVYQTTINQTINIIGDAPYYYNVQLIDSQTGDEYQGYIYKKNVSVDSPTIEDDTASNEVPPSVNDEIESSQTEDDATTE